MQARSASQQMRGVEWVLISYVRRCDELSLSRCPSKLESCRVATRRDADGVEHRVLRREHDGIRWLSTDGDVHRAAFWLISDREDLERLRATRNRVEGDGPIRVGTRARPAEQFDARVGHRAAGRVAQHDMIPGGSSARLEDTRAARIQLKASCFGRRPSGRVEREVDARRHQRRAREHCARRGAGALGPG
jgi:hypothetical protein